MSNVTALDPTVVSTWIPKCDKKLTEAEKPLKLFYKALDMHKSAKINDAQIKNTQRGKKSTYEYLTSQADIERIVLAITGWENLDFGKDHPEKPGESVIFDVKNITCIPGDIRREFAAFLTGRDKEEEQEEKEGEGINLGEAQTV